MTATGRAGPEMIRAQVDAARAVAAEVCAAFGALTGGKFGYKRVERMGLQRDEPR